MRWPVRAVMVMLLCAWPASSTSAWTEAAVSSVSADIEIERDARARVGLEVLVRVHGGWLEGLELDGLDPDLELDPERPVFAEDGEGVRYTPSATIRRGGKVLLAFRRREAPRRGQVRIVLGYVTNLAHRATEPVEGEAFGGEAVRVRWTLPGWRSGLSGISVRFRTPRGARPTELGSSTSSSLGYEGEGIEVERRDEGEHTWVTWRRVHLPRTVDWTVSVDIPAAAMDPDLGGPRRVIPTPPPPPPEAPSAEGDPLPLLLVLALTLGVLVLMARRSATRDARRVGARARAAIPGALPLAFALVAALVVGVGALGRGAPELGVALLASLAMFGVQRPAIEGGRGPGSWRPVDGRWTAAAQRRGLRQRLGAHLGLGLHTPFGLLTLALWCVLCLSVGETADLAIEWRIFACALPIPTLLSHGRARPLSPLLRLARLLRATRELRDLPPGLVLRPVVHLGLDGEPRDVRVRAYSSSEPRGLLRVDLAVADSRDAGGYASEVVLWVVTRAESAAETTLASAWPEVPVQRSASGRRVARRLVFDSSGAGLARLAEALSGCEPTPPEARVAAPSPAETLRGLPAPMALGL